ncbi:MAG: hypothetical protein J2P25_26600, partial [Nocardiopsaceae bacterium]|nr:hypothetical protein [Nocardiopsaceae bacterium]
MDQRHQRERPVRPAQARRHDQQAVELEAVGRPPGQPLLSAPADPAQFRADVADPDKAVRRAGADVGRRVGRGRQDRDRGGVVASAPRGPPGPG